MSISIDAVMEALKDDPLAFYLVDKQGEKHRVFDIKTSPFEPKKYVIADHEGIRKLVEACVPGCDCEKEYQIPEEVWDRFEGDAQRKAIAEDLAKLDAVHANFLDTSHHFDKADKVMLKSRAHESSRGLSVGKVMYVKGTFNDSDTGILWVHGYVVREAYIDHVSEEAWRLKHYVPDA